ncbi:MAG: SDR family oxidoreductase, partial [Halobacteria archaeon]|nr:SDR family oxidoreductase [Halobacteria archaeon]
NLGDEYGVSAEVVSKDLAVPGGPDEVYEEVQDRGIEVDILVNNAGIGTNGYFHETEMDDELTLVNLNVVALTHLTKLFLEDMVERGDGKILNVASSAAFQPGPLMATYYASKSYVLSFSEGIAEELRGSGVSVTALCPGPVDTDFFERADMEESNLAKRRATPEGVAKKGYKGLMKGKTVVIPSPKFKLLAFSVRLGPRFVVRKISKWLNSPS